MTETMKYFEQNVKLSVLESDRLFELRRSRFLNAGHKKATTQKLLSRGLISTIEGTGRTAKTGRILAHPDVKITEAGKAALEAYEAKNKLKSFRL